MQWKNLNDLYGCYRLLSRPENLSDIRQEVKRLLITTHELEKDDFYTEADSTYLPKKFALKKRINYQDAFDHDVIAHTIALAHQRDESFLPITQAVQTVLRETHQSFSCLLILASGSGHLASYLAAALEQRQQEQLSHTIYGVDISSTMSTQSRKNFLSQGMDPFAMPTYHAVTADCTSLTSLRRAIPELSDNRPILTISHGGARYFAQDNETDLLNTLAAFPKKSQTIITEVGAELHHLMYRLSDRAQGSESFRVGTHAGQAATRDYTCWNLSYYYYLMQQYAYSSVFRDFIDGLHIPDCRSCGQNIHNHNAGATITIQNTLSCVNLMLLEIAGARKQPIHSLELFHSPASGFLNTYPIPYASLQVAEPV